MKTLNMLRISSLSLVLVLFAGGLQAQPSMKPTSNPFGKISLCSAFSEEEGTVSDCKSKFQSSETVYLYLPIEKPGVYQLQVVFTKPFEKFPGETIDLETEGDWTYSYFWISLPEQTKPLGRWEALIYVDGALVGKQAFDVSE